MISLQDARELHRLTLDLNARFVGAAVGATGATATALGRCITKTDDAALLSQKVVLLVRREQVESAQLIAAAEIATITADIAALPTP